MQKLDFVVVGGGIVGLAIGAALSPHGSVAVLEKRGGLIEETSSRNSGVVHAGIYYPPQSLRTQLCVEGNGNIWRLQKRFPSLIHARQTGKWIGACDASEDHVIEQLAANMKRRNLPFRMVPSSELKAKEPLVRMTTVLESTSTGIVDVHSLRDFYVRAIETSPNGGFVSCHANVVRASCAPLLDTGASPANRARMPLEVVVQDTEARGADTADSTFSLRVTKGLIFAVGLHANALWPRLCVGDVTDSSQAGLRMPAAHNLSFCKGRYATCRGKPPVSRLIYPCPAPNLVGLGVHSVVDMDGQVRFGPDAVYVDDPTDLRVAVSPEDEEAFLDDQWNAIHRYLPSLERSRLAVDFAGIRPKLAGPGEPFRDFLVEEISGISPTSTEAGAYDPIMTPVTGEFTFSPMPRIVVLNGIESPGLTASSALGDFVCRSFVPPDQIDASPSPWAARDNQ